ncbi:MAG: hypothetical protein QOI92_2917 [Chloroflexota bacterium]|jgi:hypothetical protein|nr:hypothetical protein [Chloroflexota bacterium]
MHEFPLDWRVRGPESAAVTTDAAALETPDGQMFCYRHPDRETWLRCGRCDQPICTKCSVQGPVGSRCRQCGLRKNDALTAFTPQQLVLGTGAAVVGGVIVGYASSYFGLFSIILGYFAGRFIADAVTRFIGYKRGPVMLSIVFGGIIAGAVVGFFLQFGAYLGPIPGGDLDLGLLIQGLLPAVLISAGAACFGAYQRLH